MAFWIALILAGAEKGRLVVEDKLSFREIMQNISPYLTAFTIAGFGIFFGALLIMTPLLKAIKVYLIRK